MSPYQNLTTLVGWVESIEPAESEESFAFRLLERSYHEDFGTALKLRDSLLKMARIL